MLTTPTLVLMMCVTVCAQGDVFSDNTDKKSIEDTTQDTHAILDQVLDELRYLRDEDKKNKDAIKNLKNEDQKNNEENKKNKDEIDSLKEMNKQFLNKINTLKDEDKKNKEENKKNQHEIHSLKGQIKYSQAAVASAAFTAVMDVEEHHSDAGDVIPFNTVWLNIGQHYDDQTSVFTCAESGLYFFSVTLYSAGIRSGTYWHMSGALMLDGVNVAQIYSYNEDPNHYEGQQAAVTVVVECPKGGSVWVECLHSSSQIYGEDTTPTSVFTGFAISYNIHP